MKAPIKRVTVRIVDEGDNFFHSVEIIRDLSDDRQVIALEDEYGNIVWLTEPMIAPVIEELRGWFPQEEDE